MKKYLLVLLLVIAFTVMIVSVASAQAEVITDFWCTTGVFTTTGVVYVTQTNPDSIQVRSNSGNVQLTCHFDVSYMPNLIANRARDFGCSTRWGITYDTFKVTSPDDGTAMLKCMIKK